MAEIYNSLARTSSNTHSCFVKVSVNCLTMESPFSMIEGPKSHEVSNLEQINQETMQEFLSKLAIWDFCEMTMEEYTSKSADDKKLLILKYYNNLLSGIFLLFVICCWNFVFCCLDFFLVSV